MYSFRSDVSLAGDTNWAEMKKHSDLIEQNLQILVENTDLDRIVSRLERKHVLNTETIRRILNPAHDLRQQKTNLYRVFMKRGPQSFSKLRDALKESNHSDLANLLIHMDIAEGGQLNRRPSLNSIGSVDSGNSDVSRTKIEVAESAERMMRSDARVTASASDDVSPNSNCSNNSRLFKLSDYYKDVAPFLCPPDTSPSNLVNIRTGANLPVNVVTASEWKTSRYFHYKMDSYPRGCALLVNNVEFVDKVTYPDRRGSHNDQTRLNSLLEQLYFEVDSYENKTRSEMIKIVKEFSEKEELKKVDCAMIVFMSHGAEGASEEDTEIIGVDGFGLKTKEIIRYFNHDNCQALIRKPKVFLFQACRGGLADQGTLFPNGHYRTEIDGQKINSTNRPVRIRSAADIFIAYAVPPGRPANRDIFNGTWFIQTVIDVFEKNACNHDLEDMLKMVDNKIQKLNLADCSNFQTVTTTTIGWSKKLFFNPGLRLGSGSGVKSEVTVGDHCLDSTGGGGEGNEEEGTDCIISGCVPRSKCTLI